jgi:hypothetical protein
MSLIGTVLGEESQTPELLRFFRKKIVAPRRAILRVVIERAGERGELRDNDQPDAVANVLIGGLYARYLVSTRIEPTYPAKLAEMYGTGSGKRLDRRRDFSVWSLYAARLRSPGSIW